MSEITISVLAAEDIIDDLCADPALKAKKSPAPPMPAGGPKIDPFTAAVAVATTIVGAAKIVEASKLIARSVSKWLAGDDKSRQVIEVAIRKQDGDFHVLHFEKGAAIEEIEETIRDCLRE